MNGFLGLNTPSHGALAAMSRYNATKVPKNNPAYKQEWIDFSRNTKR